MAIREGYIVYTCLERARLVEVPPWNVLEMGGPGTLDGEPFGAVLYLVGNERRFASEDEANILEQHRQAIDFWEARKAANQGPPPA